MVNKNILTVVGIHIFDRIKEARRSQQLFSRYGRLIKVRLGFHELNDDVCSRAGIILLKVDGQHPDFNDFYEQLKALGGVEIQKMTFSI